MQSIEESVRKEIVFTSIGLHSLILASAEAALALQSIAGSMPPGHNGPYFDPETPVRNTAHWLITFMKAHKISGDQVYLEAARRAIAFLHSQEARPMGGSFWLRKNPEKDFCNGLIGQAWIIEALAIAAKYLGDEASHCLAESVFLQHPFDERLGLWRRINVDGSYLPLDMTFNHQLWFAAAGSLLLPTQDTRVLERARRFLDTVSQNITIYSNGLIRHPLTLDPLKMGRIKRFSKFVHDSFVSSKEELGRDKFYDKSLGYHSYNLYGFALLKQQFPDHAFWKSKKFMKMLAYVELSEYYTGLEGNKYGYPFNPPGFEVAFALGVFKMDSEEKQAWWVSEQMRRYFNFGTNMLMSKSEDPITQAARFYEATRLPNFEIHING
jgi:hypothetical protein